ncbi:MAG: hypothetical protein RBU45_26795, partial [Myxococcota bacterium]|nr:hypothetical protein [Myxococcota bacterium]
MKRLSVLVLATCLSFAAAAGTAQGQSAAERGRAKLLEDEGRRFSAPARMSRRRSTATVSTIPTTTKARPSSSPRITDLSFQR